MKTYSDLVDRVFLQKEQLSRLIPDGVANLELRERICAADDATLAGGRAIGDAATFALVRGALLYAIDAMPEAHAIFQEAHGDLGSYWHGMMHRREGDFDNARYWFRRAGALPFFSELHRAASGPSALMARQSNWDPYAFTGQCEQARFGETENLAELLTLQRMEFEVLFDYCWRQSALD